MPYRLSADIGGTFTDIVRLDIDSGRCDTTKVPTTLGNLADGITAGFDQVTGGRYDDVVDIVHGTTHGLNSLIERTGAPTAVIMTHGFRDSYEIGRGNHKDMYDVRYRKPRPLVARQDIFEVTERTRTDGSVETPLDLAEAAAVLDRVAAGGYTSLAVCLINSFADPGHERALRDLARERLGEAVSVTASADISPETREYERFSTAILNAYIAPAMNRYLRTLDDLLHERGFRGRLTIMNSNGGRMSVRTARSQPVRTLMSGPIGGVIGASKVGVGAGSQHLIAVDMGGTSFDVSMLDDGGLDIVMESTVEDVPVLVPTVNTLSVGAGGGSIAWTEAGAMRVGPQSSGARPGPIAYGHGGTLPTVTDANLVLGRMDPANFLGGRMSLDLAGPLAAFEEYGAVHALAAVDAAEGALEIANSTMADAIREITLWRGRDVRDFALLAYGGAGPMHAALIADQLDVRRVIVPQQPGAFSAWGMLHADITLDRSRSVMRLLAQLSPADYTEIVDRLAAELLDQMATETDDADRTVLVGSVDLRYVGQEFALTLPVGDTFDADRIRQEFDRAYLRLYGFSSPVVPVEALNVRLVATVAERRTPRTEHVPDDGGPAAPRTLTGYVGGEVRPVPVHPRASIRPQDTLAGPALVVELTSTTFVPDGWTAQVDHEGSLVLDSTRPQNDEE
ncbi:MAG TPA: hydantoinase/oxoprolinase family protein [Cellulomonas sp.]